MKNFNLFILFAAMVPVFLCAGCGGGSISIPSFGAVPSAGATASSPYFAIQTVTGTNPTEKWSNVQITGYADANTLASACSVASDSSCIGEVGGPFIYAVQENAIPTFTTNVNGQANFYTNGQPAIWYFYAKDPNNGGCSQSKASSQTYQGEPDGSSVLLSCGSNEASMLASPAACTTTDNEITHRVISTCPATVILSFPSSSTVSLPLSTTLAAANYSTSGANLAQASVTASTTATVSVPTPTQQGLSYIAVQDPSSGAVIGVAEFTYYYDVITPPRCGDHPCTD